MNQDKVVSANVNFQPLSYEETFANIESDNENLIDIYFSLNGKSLITNDNSSGKSTNDVRVYYHYHNGFNPDNREEEDEFVTDITHSVICELRRMIDLDEAKTRCQYKAALDEWLFTEKKLGTEYPGGEIFNEEILIARKQKNMQPLSSCLDQLGNHAIGWGGNLHIFNFLYNYIDIPPISLSSVIRHHNKNSDEKIDPHTLSRAKLTFSSGKCRKFIPHIEWLQAELMLGGTLMVRLEYYYLNPLIEKLIQLEQRVDKLEDRASDVEQRIDKLEDRAFGAEQRIDKLEERALNAEQRCSTIEREILIINAGVKGQEVRLADIELSLQEIRPYIDPAEERSIQRRLDILDKNNMELATSSAKISEALSSNNTQATNLHKKIDTLKESIRQLIGS